MLEYGLLACCIVLSSLGLVIVFLPWRKQMAKRMMLFGCGVLGVVGLAYWIWGAWPEQHAYLRQVANQQRVRAMLQSVKGPHELIDKLKAHLQQKPTSAQGWYLLGRLYVSQGESTLALQAFATAHQLQPNDALFSVNYAQSLFGQGDESFAEKARQLLSDVLQNDPKQPDALAMLAMDAYSRHLYQQAIDYWQRLLAQVPAQSDEAAALRKAIAKARQHE